MSMPLRAPRRPGAPPPDPRCHRLLTLNASTVSGNVSTGPAGGIASGTGHNLIGNLGTGTGTGACSGLANGVNGDQVSVPAGLLPLASNGGSTDTAVAGPNQPGDRRWQPDHLRAGSHQRHRPARPQPQRHHPWRLRHRRLRHRRRLVTPAR
jgi:hypothetical protein